MTPPPKNKEYFRIFKPVFQSESPVNSKIFNKYYTRGKIERTKVYFHIIPDPNSSLELRGYLYFKLGLTEDQALTQWLKVRLPKFYSALLSLKKHTIITQQELKKLGWTDTAFISTLSAHNYLGIKRRWLGNGKPIVYYTCSDDKLDEWIIDKLPEIVYADKALYIKKAYKFQNETMPKVIKSWFGKTAKIDTECYRRGLDGMTYKFDLITNKRIKWLNGNRDIPIILEVKDFFLSNHRFNGVVWFKHKLNQCFNKGNYLAIICCQGADSITIERANGMGIWVKDIRGDLKQLKKKIN